MKVKATIAALIGFTGIAFAQQSEFQGKLQEDLDSSKKHVISSCGASDKVEVKWTGGKLAGNPREGSPSVSTLCRSAIGAATDACRGNKVVKEKLSKLTRVACTPGKGALDFKLAGSTLTLMIDTSYTKDNPATQSSALDKKIRAKLDD